MLFKEGAYILANDKRSRVSSKEGSVGYIIENPAKHSVVQYLLDKGIIPEKNNDMIRCDQIVEFPDESEPIVYLIELKSSNIDHALEQLDSSIKLLFDATYRKKCNEFMEACDTAALSALQGRFVRLRTITSKPQNATERPATHAIQSTKEKKLMQTCKRYAIVYDKKLMIRKSGTSETL